MSLELRCSCVPGSLDNEAQCWKLAWPIADQRSLILDTLTGPVKLALHRGMDTLNVPDKEVIKLGSVQQAQVGVAVHKQLLRMLPLPLS